MFLIFKLVERGSKEKILKAIPSSTIGAFVFYPAAAMIRRGHSEGIKLSEKEKEAIFNMAWDAIRI